MADVVPLLQSLMNNDNNLRRQAEEQLTAAKQHPEFLIPALVDVVRGQADAGVKQMGAIVLRKCLASEHGQADIYTALSPQSATALRAALLELLTAQGQPGPVRKAVESAVGALGARLLDQSQGQPNRWPELMPFLFAAVQGGGEDQVCSALAIFATLATPLLDTQLFKDNMAMIGQVFSSCLAHASSKVRLTAVESTASVVQILSDDDYLKPFTTLVAPMMQCVSAALNEGKQDDAQEIINSMVAIAENQSDFFTHSSHLPSVFNAMHTVAESTNLEDEVRHIAVEFMITFAEADPRAAKKVPGFLARIIPFLMNWMLDPVDAEDLQAWGNTIEDDEDVCNYDVGLEGLDRLAIAIGGKMFEKPLSQEVQKFLSQHSGDWRYRHAAILAMSQTAEGCQKQFKPALATMVPTVLRHFTDAHPRVRFTAVQCIAQFCTDFQPEFQSDFAEQVLPAITEMLKDSVPRIRHHAAASVVNFCDEADPAIYGHYVEHLLVTLYQILAKQEEPLWLKEQVLSAVSAVAENCAERFAPFYDNFMPVMKAIIALPEAKENRTIKGKAIECASFIALCAKKDRFGAPGPDGQSDSAVIMGYMHVLTQSQLEGDDPRGQYLMQAWARLAQCIGAQFAQYLDAVIPPVLAKCTNEDDVEVLDDDDDVSSDEDVQCIRLAIKGVGEKKLAIRTSLLEEKSLALSMLVSYFASLKEHMFPWVERIAQAVVPLVTNPYLEDIRETAAKICPLMLMCAKTRVEQGAAPPVVMQQLLQYVVPKIVEALRQETEANVAGTLMENLHESIDACGAECLSPQDLEGMKGTVQEVFEESLQRRAHIVKEHAEQHEDEDEQAKLDEQANDEETLLTQSVEVIGTLIKTHPNQFIPVFTSVFLPFFTQMLDIQKFGALEHKLSLCVLDDFVEYGQDAALPYFPDIVKALIGFSVSEDPEVQQACVYGLGICAQFVTAKPGRAWPDGAVPQVMQVLQRVCTRKVGKDDEEWYAPVCNAVSSLLKMLRLFRGQPGISDAEILPGIFPQLPVKGDEVEARIVHQEIFNYVEQQNPVVVGQDGANLPAIRQIAQQLLSTAPNEPCYINDSTRAHIHKMLGIPMPQAP